MTNMRPRVLVMDDDQELVTHIAEWLEVEYEVTTTGLLAEAKDAVNRRREAGGGEFELIISDYDVPDGVGTGLASYVREGAPTVPVLYITGDPGWTTKDRAFRADDPVLRKPFSMKQMERVIARLLKPDV
jgi:two-component system OmpR family response regulator